MKKSISIALALCLTIPFLSLAKGPQDKIQLLSQKNATLRAESEVKDSLIADLRAELMAIPDTLCVTALDSTFCVPTKDAQEVVTPIVDYVKKTNNDGWPTTGKGWLLWLLGLFPLIFGAKKLTSINNVWKILQPYLKSRLGLAILAGGALSALATFLVSLVTKDFNTTMLMVIWPWAALGASYIHNIKAKKGGVQA